MLMHIPVYEKFVELGYQAFVNPTDVYEEFRSGGIFRRAGMLTSLPMPTKQSNSLERESNERLLQREALMDLALLTGLALVIADYVKAYEIESSQEKSFFLKDPVAINRWVSQSLHNIREDNDRILPDILGNTQKLSVEEDENEAIKLLSQNMTKLKGLRAVILALMDRLQFGHSMEMIHTSKDIQLLAQSGLKELRKLLKIIQCTFLQCQFALWFNEKSLTYHAKKTRDLFNHRHEQKLDHFKQFLETWDLYEDEDFTQPKSLFLLDSIQSIAGRNTESQYPPLSAQAVCKLIECIPDESYDDMERDIDSLFSFQLAIVLYYCLDQIYLTKVQIEKGKEFDDNLMHEIRQIASSFSQTMGLPKKMSNAIIGLWLMDSCVSTFHSTAINLLTDVCVAGDLENVLVLDILRNLLEQEDYINAMKLLSIMAPTNSKEWSMDLTLMTMICYLSLGQWKLAIQLYHFVPLHEYTKQFQKKLLFIYFTWFEKENQLIKLVGQFMNEEEEKVLEEFFIQPKGEISSSKSIQHVDLLIARLLQQSQIRKALQIDIEHRSCLQKCGVSKVLTNKSFEIRSSLIDVYRKMSHASHEDIQISLNPNECNRNRFLDAMEKMKERNKKLMMMMKEKNVSEPITKELQYEKLSTPNLLMKDIVDNEMEKKEEEEEKEEKEERNELMIKDVERIEDEIISTTKKLIFDIPYSPGTFSGREVHHNIKEEKSNEIIKKKKKDSLLNYENKVIEEEENENEIKVMQEDSSLSIKKKKQLTPILPRPKEKVQQHEELLTNMDRKKIETPFKNIARRRHLRTPPVKPSYHPRESTSKSSPPLKPTTISNLSLSSSKTMVNEIKPNTSLNSILANELKNGNNKSSSMETVSMPFSFMSNNIASPQSSSMVKSAEFFTPSGYNTRLNTAKQGNQSVPVRRNPKRSARKKY